MALDLPKHLVYDSWLSEIMDSFVCRLVIDDSLSLSNSLLQILEGSVLLSSESKAIFIYSKLPIDLNSPKLVKSLQNQGFYLIDTNIILEKPFSSSGNFTCNNCSIRFAHLNNKDQVVALARNNFTFSRFHMDDEILYLLANKIKAEWASNFFAGKRGDKMVVALIDNVVVGFLLLLASMETLIIDLIAVDKNQRGKGIASKMITYVQNHQKGFSLIKVGTQLANIPSIRLYEKMGFRICSSSYVFHYHKKDTAVT